MPASQDSPTAMFFTSSGHAMVHEPNLAGELRIPFTILKGYFCKKHTIP